MDKIYHGRDVLKRQIAEELGYAEKVRNFGWGELTSVEAGRDRRTGDRVYEKAQLVKKCIR